MPAVYPRSRGKISSKRKIVQSERSHDVTVFSKGKENNDKNLNFSTCVFWVYFKHFIQNDMRKVSLWLKNKSLKIKNNVKQSK